MRKKNNIFIIIPARGGSKSIKNKNLHIINKKPLLQWTLEESQKIKSVDKIIVSTDDKQIKKFAKKFDVDVIDRPKRISNDNSSSESAILHTLNHYNEKNINPEIIVFLQCTSPLITFCDIEKGINYLNENGLDSTFACSSFDGFIWKNKNEQFIGINHDHSKRLMRQKRSTEYLEAGSIYIMRTKIFLRDKYRFCGKCKPFLIDKNKVLDINDYQDADMAEIYLKNIKLKNKIIFNQPKALIMDFDGVHTDNKVYLDSNGDELVLCSRSDGMGLKQLKENSGIKLLIISNEQNQVVQKRATKLNIECIQTNGKKIEILDNWLKKNTLKYEDVIFIGNDINDIDCIQRVGISFCPNDAENLIKENVDHVLKQSGGNGAIRELAEILLSKIND
ncbi:MAG: hypothetical protein CBC25_02275 [Pelagibacteraceae bacterium TMED65]|nr:hypothetical protein [Rickettsiales bacterium]OUU52727.1 MAG: hypothetical protein CBC25_02275 [Pelagibacteraceae bacterium TMED65]